METRKELTQKDAVDFIKTNPEIMLILMDLKLPVLDGYKATSLIKKLNPNIRIIAQTAFAGTGDKEKAINAGCNDYITKPIDPRKLLELVNTNLSN